MMDEPLLSQPDGAKEGVSDLDLQKPQHLYPSPFYCPLTEKVMEDPVVGADGKSFERCAVQEQDSADDASEQQQDCYPNRALKIIIEKEINLQMEKGTVRGALRKAGESLASLALQNDDSRPLPDVCYCPITLDIIARAAIDPDGNTYERWAIRSWIRRNGNSPLTRNKLSVNQLRDNRTLEDVIDAMVNNVPDPNDPSILKWKELRRTIEDEENRRNSLLDEMEESEERSLSTPMLEEVSDEYSRGTCILLFAAFFLVLSWSMFAVIPLDIIPLNVLVYIVMGLLISFLNIVLIEHFAGRGRD